MSAQNSTITHTQMVFEEWAQSANQFWGAMTQSWPAAGSTDGLSTTLDTAWDIYQEAVRISAKIFQDEFQSVINTPKIGLTRTYQENVSRAVEKFSALNAKLLEFSQLLHVPVKKSATALQDNLSQLNLEGLSPEELKNCYRKWLKDLEKQYLEFLRSPEFCQGMGATLLSMGEFTEARDQIFQDMMKMVGVPTEKEMDELYRDMYEMKKRLKKLEKMNGGETPADQSND